MNKLFDTQSSHSLAGGPDLPAEDALSHALVVRSDTLYHGPHLRQGGQVRSGPDVLP